MTTELIDDEDLPLDPVDFLGPPELIVPSIPNGAQADVPPEGGVSSLLINTPPDPQGDHTRWMDRVKLTFAVWVVIVSFLVVVGLTITQFVTQKTLDSVPLDSAVDWAKSIATIALGFALGRSIEESKSEKSAD
jgi:hypothetical protein